ncbi:helix-turn-helix protein [Hydrogenispora ethanolica]|uniref:Helix-turn-helix protein n=1 Tax=Hydrogenispora ethanolica TaxID=1082276 RepID=A0A4R1RTZ8_HYDET|nr:response regulator [Hydrogenispora ethanolica]TCL70021.1 helix-turn-helix protein [Hydrogenispora ethanolica]
MYRLIIVDDEAEIRAGLCNYFPWNQLGFEVAGQFENGLQALEYIESCPVDVLLCDIRMPFMSGLELAKELNARGSQVKILLLSGYREFDYAREALEYGVKDYIIKPTKYDELIKSFSKIKAELDREKAPKEPAEKAGEGIGYNEKVIATVKNYLQDNFQTATLEEAAQLVHMNPFYLSKFFKDKTGENFSDFLIAVRMERAARFLNDIAYKTYEISEMVGYSNPKNFTRTFKKYFGKTPKEFRNFS